MRGRVVASNQHPKRSAAGATEHEPHYSTDDASAGRALKGSTTPARGSGQTRNESQPLVLERWIVDEAASLDPIFKEIALKGQSNGSIVVREFFR